MGRKIFLVALASLRRSSWTQGVLSTVQSRCEAAIRWRFCFRALAFHHVAVGAVQWGRSCEGGRCHRSIFVDSINEHCRPCAQRLEPVSTWTGITRHTWRVLLSNCSQQTSKVYQLLRRYHEERGRKDDDAIGYCLGAQSRQYTFQWQERSVPQEIRGKVGPRSCPY
jgi:hypothetical protein